MKRAKNKVLKPFSQLFELIGDLWYGLKVKIYAKIGKKGKNKKLGTQKKLDSVFYYALIALPLFMFSLQQIAINGNSILLAFQKYDIATNRQFFAGFENFAEVIRDFITKSEFQDMLIRSTTLYLLSTAINTIVPIMFSYYIYKKLLGSRIFKMVLFIPTIMSSIITVSIYRQLTNQVVPSLISDIFGKEIFPLLSNPNTTYNTVVFYTIWMGFGGGLLTQLAAMNTVDESVKESAKLEGIGFFQEFWYIVLPACYQVLSLGLITGFAAIFTNNLNLYAFFGLSATPRVRTLGYYFYTRTLEAETADYNYLSAWGLLITLIAMPVTLTLRHIIYKYGPSED